MELVPRTTLKGRTEEVREDLLQTFRCWSPNRLRNQLDHDRGRLRGHIDKLATTYHNII